MRGGVVEAGEVLSAGARRRGLPRDEHTIEGQTGEPSHVLCADSSQKNEIGSYYIWRDY